LRNFDLLRAPNFFRTSNTPSGSASDIIGTILTMLIILLLAFSLFLLGFVITSPKSEDGATRVLGHELLLVTTNSMEDTGDTDTSNFEIKSFKKNTLIAIERVPEDAAQAAVWYDSVKVGDVLTFRYVYDRQMTITHRVISKVENGKGGYIIELSGDNKNAEVARLNQTIDTSDTESFNYIMGRVVWTSHVIGSIVGACQRAIQAIVQG
jgi:hypothetical protein